MKSLGKRQAASKIARCAALECARSDRSTAASTFRVAGNGCRAARFAVSFSRDQWSIGRDERSSGFKSCPTSGLLGNFAVRSRFQIGSSVDEAGTSIDGGSEHCRQRLSQRESEVLKLLADCKSNKDIAREMNISVRTAETYRARVMMKLELPSIGHLIRFAVRNNIIKA
jgi:DNA-binding CsgD family transcriptional regulator